MCATFIFSSLILVVMQRHTPPQATPSMPMPPSGVAGPYCSRHIPAVGMCSIFIFFSFILVVMQRCTPPSHLVDADAPHGGRLILLQQAHPYNGDVW
jgi:hypothetical protein